MNKLILLLFALLVCTIKANQPNVFDEDAKTNASASTLSSYDDRADSESGPNGPPGNGGNGGVGGNGTGSPVSIDMYEWGLLLAGGFIIFYRMNSIRRKKVGLTHHNIKR